MQRTPLVATIDFFKPLVMHPLWWYISYPSLAFFIFFSTFTHCVQIGEASHGTNEFYRERALITQRLIKEKGFNAVIVEADWPDAYRINRYMPNLLWNLDADIQLNVILCKNVEDMFRARVPETVQQRRAWEILQDSPNGCGETHKCFALSSGSKTTTMHLETHVKGSVQVDIFP